MNHLQTKHFACIAFLLMICCGIDGYGQLLNWQFENILDDRRESGLYPDMVIANNGDIHFSYWDKSRDQLVYGKRDVSSGAYTLEDVDPLLFAGYRSAIVLDAAENVHIAYYLNDQGIARLRHATNAGGSWVIEEPDTATLGKYGPDLGFDSYVELSLDIDFDPSGEPVISYFDATIFDFGFCNAGPSSLNTGLPKTFELDMHVSQRTAGGTWVVKDLDVVSRKVPGGCNNIGFDRFGEFSKLIPAGTDKMFVLTNSFYNHEMLLGEAQTTDLQTWRFTVIDSIERFVIPSSLNLIRYEDAFGFCDANVIGDSLLHLVYNSSQAYGLEFFQRTPRNPLRNFFYTRIYLDSLGMTDTLGNLIYTPSHYQFADAPFDLHYRTFQTITSRGPDSIYIAHYNSNISVVVLSESVDGGLTWVNDTVKRDYFTTSSLVLENHNDSLFLMTSDGINEKLDLFSRQIGGGPWREESTTQNERRATYLGADIERDGSGNDKIHIAFDETSDDQLYYGVQSGGNWSFEPVDIPEMNVRHIDLKVDGNSNPGISYIFEASDELKFAYHTGGSWQIDVVDPVSMQQDARLAISGDTAHIVYYSRVDRAPKHARSKLGSGIWSSETIGNSADDTGKDIDVCLNDQAELLVTYLDETSSRMIFGHRSNGAWNLESVTDTLGFDPSQMSIATAPVSKIPMISFRDNIENRVMFAEKETGGAWKVTEVIQSPTNFLGAPLRLVVDPKDKPLTLYNFVTTSEEVRLLRRANINWFPISVNNPNEIAGTFEFLAVENDLFIIGRKNEPDNNGIGMLFAPDGIKTDLEQDAATLSGVDMFPNPARDEVAVSFSLEKSAAVSLELIDLNGRVLQHPERGDILPQGSHSIYLATDGLVNGVYFVRLIQGGRAITRKLVILR